jgi:hypothetical protein
VPRLKVELADPDSHPKSGALWKCVAEHYFPHLPGKIYEMEFREDAWEHKLEAAWPAIEPIQVISNEWKEYIVQPINEIEDSLPNLREKGLPEYARCGFGADDTTLYLPDPELFQHLFPDFKIRAADEGSADNATFIQAFIDGEMILSTQKEFVHDMTIHILSQLRNSLVVPDRYRDVREIQRRHVRVLNDIISEKKGDVDPEVKKTAEEVEQLVGFLIDDLTTELINGRPKHYAGIYGRELAMLDLPEIGLKQWREKFGRDLDNRRILSELNLLNFYPFAHRAKEASAGAGAGKAEG